MNEQGKSKTEIEVKKIKVYIVEEQGLLRDAYSAVLPSEPTLDVLGISSDSSTEGIMSVLSAIQPDAVILGTKLLSPTNVEQLETIREQFPDMGIVLLSAVYDIHGINKLREFTMKGSSGWAFFLKHSIERPSQLTQLVHTVTEGQVSFDAMVMESLVGSGENRANLLKKLTHRELEVLSWMEKGYRNQTIADVLDVDVKIIERHTNSIYSKLNMETNSKHPRVSSILLYLKATGQLPDYDLLVK